MIMIVKLKRIRIGMEITDAENHGNVLVQDCVKNMFTELKVLEELAGAEAQMLVL